MKKMIEVNVEISFLGGTITGYYDVPDRWDEMTEAERDREITESAVEFRESVASCGGWIIEVEDDFEG